MLVDVQGFEGRYAASDDGRIWSYLVNRYLKPVYDRGGYLKVLLHDSNGVRYTKFVHRIIAETFIPNPNNYPQINHKDENKHNNAVDNLEWCTSKYNINYGTRNAKVSKARINHPCASKCVLCIETGIIYPSTQEAMRQTGITHVRDACSGVAKSAGGYHWIYV